MSTKKWMEQANHLKYLRSLKDQKMTTSLFNGVSKRCTRCGLRKPIDQFGYRRASADKLQFYCKLCSQEVARHNYWAKVNAGKINGDETAPSATEVLPHKDQKDPLKVLAGSLGARARWANTTRAQRVEIMKRVINSRRRGPTTQIEDKREVKKMAYRSYEIDGTRWTPLMDIAIGLKRSPSSVHTKAEALGRETKLIAPMPFQRRLKMVKTADVAELEKALEKMPRLGYPRHRRSTKRRPWAVSPPRGTETTQEAPTPAAKMGTNDPARQFVSKLRELKPLAAAMGIKLEELVFRNGEVSFQMTKTEVVKSEVVVKL